MIEKIANIADSNIENVINVIIFLVINLIFLENIFFSSICDKI
jgi:hypothetical protein